MNFYNKTLLAVAVITSGFIFAGCTSCKKRPAVGVKPATVQLSKRTKKAQRPVARRKHKKSIKYTKPVVVAAFKKAKAGSKNCQPCNPVKSVAAPAAKQPVIKTSVTPVETVVALTKEAPKGGCTTGCCGKGGCKI